MAQPSQHRPHRSWPRKFADAFRGAKVGIRGQRSFVVHLPAAAAVIVAAVVMRLAPAEWCILLVCITIVLAAEMFNSALEAITRAITRKDDENIRDALDIASAAVLVASTGAALVGAIVLGRRLGQMLGWWG
jgi:diacylglycerol kinase